MASPPGPELPLLVARHAPWEGPHRITDAFAGVPVTVVDALEPGAAWPAHHEVRGAVLMGGPMSVNDTAALPGLVPEIAWIREGLARGVPMLGVCLGSQLIARAAGAAVTPGPRPEIGWLPVEIADARDPVVGPLAPMTVALHWHGEAFDLPEGAVPLARSAITPVQTFRLGSAWGVLFHPEADAALLDAWLAEPAMRAEAEQAIGPDFEAALRMGAERHAAGLVEASTRGFAAFAALCA